MSEPKYGTPEWDEYVVQQRLRLERVHGKHNVWNTDEVTKEFEIDSFLAPFVFAHKRSNNKKGVLVFQHSPRFYYSWIED